MSTRPIIEILVCAKQYKPIRYLMHSTFDGINYRQCMISPNQAKHVEFVWNGQIVFHIYSKPDKANQLPKQTQVQGYTIKSDKRLLSPTRGGFLICALGAAS